MSTVLEEIDKLDVVPRRRSDDRVELLLQHPDSLWFLCILAELSPEALTFLLNSVRNLPPASTDRRQRL